MKFLLIFLTLLVSASPSFAKCYSMKEVEAEQGIRIHSELMVIGLNCQHLWPKSEKNLYTQYRSFTTKHEKVFADYETTLLKFYAAEGGGSPDARLHVLRTDFANAISKDAAVMRPDAFCKTYAPRIPKAAKMDDAKIKRWAATVFPGHPVSHKMCSSR